MSPNKFTQGHLMKTEWSVTDVAAVGSPDRAEYDIVEVISVERFLGQFSPYLLSGSHFVIYDPPLER